MRKLFLMAAGCVCLPYSGNVMAQGDAITLLTTYNATGFSSRTSSIMAPKLEEFFQLPVEVEFQTATQVAVDAPADGNTLFVSTIGNMALLPSISPSFGIDPLIDLQPVTLLTQAPDVLIVHSGLGVTTLDELIAYSNEHPGTLSYSHISPRSIHRVEFTAILEELGIDATLDESMRGAAGAMDGVATGAIDLVITTSPYVAPLVEDGSVIPLAVAHPTRMPLYPDVPTLLERGVSLIPHGSWAGLFVPVGTSDENISRIRDAVHFALSDAGVIAEVNALGMEVSLSDSPEAFTAFIESDNVRLKLVAEIYGIVVE
jgi:tripartite-type tricarboxylate transporter receptor subunit TctC